MTFLNSTTFFAHPGSIWNSKIFFSACKIGVRCNKVWLNHKKSKKALFETVNEKLCLNGVFQKIHKPGLFL